MCSMNNNNDTQSSNVTTDELNPTELSDFTNKSMEHHGQPGIRLVDIIPALSTDVEGQRLFRC